MQDAYVSEAGGYYGSWAMIGYTMTSTTNFKFLENGTAENGVAAASSTALGTAAVTWGALYGAKVTGGPTGKCVILTPSFGKLSPNPVEAAPAGN